MILTCPKCATGYFVDDAQIGASGRKVRCAACGERWTALPVVAPAEGALALEPSPDAPANEALGGIDLPRAFRSRAEEERRMRAAATAGAAWAGAVVAVVAVVGAGILFRENVVRVWPQTASAYSVIGLPVNPVGLVIDNVKAEPGLMQGHAILSVSGEIRNVVDREVSAPPLRVTLLNAQGKRVAGQIDPIANARIPPGETRHFATAIFDPPFSAHDLSVDFAIGADPRTLPTRQRPLSPQLAPSNALPLPLRGATPSPAGNAAPAPAHAVAGARA